MIPIAGFDHIRHPKHINLNAVRLSFQALILEDGEWTLLRPVVSEPIHDRRSKNNLMIFDVSLEVSPASGGQKIILLCDKVTKGDICVQLFEKDENGLTVWQSIIDSAKNKEILVHRQTAISFFTPAYRTPHILEPVKTFMQLYRPSDQATSEPIPFEYVPEEMVSEYSMRRKQPKGLNGKEEQHVKTSSNKKYHYCCATC